MTPTTPDILVSGAGPAGSLTAILLARAGLRVHVVDRAMFPRDTLCGDTLNPGAMAILARHGLASGVEARSIPITGMMVTGAGGVSVRAEYGEGICGRALTRRVLDALLVDAAVAAGATLETGVVVRGPWLDAGGNVRGLRLAAADGRDRHVAAALTIAADGRRSIVARALQLTYQPARLRRWALGAYFTGVAALAMCGEMHVRRGHYIGVAPLGDGLVNACVVLPEGARDPAAFRDTGALIDGALRADAALGPRFAGARRVSPPVLRGPLAVDARAAGAPGLLLVGDAAGFIDPMTGDGLRFALRGAELAAACALDALQSGTTATAHLRLARDRTDAFASKWRLNRALRALVASPTAVTAAAWSARLVPAAVETLIRLAADIEHPAPST